MRTRESLLAGAPAVLFLAAMGCGTSSSSAGPKDSGLDAADARSDRSAPDGGDAGPDAPLWPTPAAWDKPVTRPASDGAAQAARAACMFKRGDMPAATLDPSYPLDEKNPIKNIVVLMQENRSFDTYAGHLYKYAHKTPAEINSAPDTTTNPDAMGMTHPYQHAPQLCFADTDHSWYGGHHEWDNGKNDGFYIVNNGTPMVTEAGVNLEDGDRALWWYDERDIPFYYDLWNTFAISDSYFCAVLGPTWPNRMYLYGATSLGQTGSTWPDISAYPTVPSNLAVFDLLAQRGVSFNIFAMGPTSSTAGVAGISVFEGLLWEQRYKPLTVLQPFDAFLSRAKAGTLPAVSFVDPNFTGEGPAGDDEHPPAQIQIGQQFAWQVVNAVLTSPQWKETALFITYDENGGEYDHVSPPDACAPDSIKPILSGTDVGTPGGFDRYGFRVPLTVISPYAKKSYVSHVVNSHTSITRFIEAKFKLPALTARDANADALSDMFDWASPPYMKPPTFKQPPTDSAAVTFCKATYPSSSGGGP